MPSSLESTFKGILAQVREISSASSVGDAVDQLVEG